MTEKDLAIRKRRDLIIHFLVEKPDHSATTEEILEMLKKNCCNTGENTLIKDYRYINKSFPSENSKPPIKRRKGKYILSSDFADKYSNNSVTILTTETTKIIFPNTTKAQLQAVLFLMKKNPLSLSEKNTSKSLKNIKDANNWCKLGTSEIVSDGWVRKNVLNPLRKNGLIEMTNSKTYKNNQEYWFFHIPADDATLINCLFSKTRINRNAAQPLMKYFFEAKNNYISTKSITRLEEITAPANHDNITRILIDQNVNDDYMVYKNNILLLRLCKDYQPISFDYYTQSGEIKSVPFFIVGFIAFSEDRALFYVIGKTTTQPNSRKNPYSMIDTSKIIFKTIKTVKSSICNNVNNDTNQKEFDLIQKEMFNVSFENPIDVNVSIPAEYKEIVEDFAKLKDNRTRQIDSPTTLPKLEINDSGTQWIYTDRIRGMSDFARFIRKYGSKVSVKNCEVLRKQMITTCKKLMERYSEYSEDSVNKILP